MSLRSARFSPGLEDFQTSFQLRPLLVETAMVAESSACGQGRGVDFKAGDDVGAFDLEDGFGGLAGSGGNKAGGITAHGLDVVAADDGGGEVGFIEDGGEGAIAVAADVVAGLKAWGSQSVRSESLPRLGTK